MHHHHLDHILLLYFGILDRGAVLTAPRFHRSLFEPALAAFGRVTTACSDLLLAEVDGVPRCFGAARTLGCDRYEPISAAALANLTRPYKDRLHFHLYSPSATKHALNQLASESVAASFGLRVATAVGANRIIAVSADFYFVRPFPVDILVTQPGEVGGVFTSTQMDGDGGYTNGLYAGSVRNVVRVMSRFNALEMFLDMHRDYERLLRIAGFERNAIARLTLPVRNRSGPFAFFKVRATCAIVWPIGWFSRKGFNRTTRYAFLEHRRLVNTTNALSSCTCHEK